MNKTNDNPQGAALLIGCLEDIAASANEALKQRGASSTIGRSIILQYKKKPGRLLYYDKATGRVCVDYKIAANGN